MWTELDDYDRMRVEKAFGRGLYTTPAEGLFLFVYSSGKTDNRCLWSVFFDLYQKPLLASGFGLKLFVLLNDFFLIKIGFIKPLIKDTTVLDKSSFLLIKNAARMVNLVSNGERLFF